MAKIELDKYYTPPDLAKYIVNKTKEIIGEDNITEYIEPSAGAGAFLDYLDKPYLAYDIEPEDNRIKKQDFLELNLEYKKGRCVIGNPPFGNRNSLTRKFYQKAVKISDYIVFIMPIGQLNGSLTFYEFDLLHSEDLGIKNYSNRKIHCCLNMYIKPKNGINKKPNYNLNDILIKEYRPTRNQHISKDFPYDIRICFWGSIGNESEYIGQYSHEMAIQINNKKYKQEIINLIKNTDWNKIYPQVGTPCLYQWQICKYLKEQIPEIN